MARTRRAPEISEEDRDALVAYLLTLRSDLIRDFMTQHDLLRSGTKQELRERVREALEEGALGASDIIDYLDAVEPWGKQHVFLYEGSEPQSAEWADAGAVRERLLDAGVESLLDERLPLAMPAELTLSSIRLEPGNELTVVAVERREHRERDPERDRVEPGDGQVEFLAYRRVITRGLVILRWNLFANTAALHITQGHTGYNYGETEQRLRDLVRPWLNFDAFQRVDLHAAVRALHELEEQGQGDARSHRLDYRTHGGRQIRAVSPSKDLSVLGETAVDQTLRVVRAGGTGNLGNVYWLPQSGPQPASNPLQREVHIVIVADEQRVNFMTPNPREVVLYVLQRVRALSG